MNVNHILCCTVLYFLIIVLLTAVPFSGTYMYTVCYLLQVGSPKLICDFSVGLLSGFPLTPKWSLLCS